MNKNLDLEYKHEWLQKMADVCEASSTIDSTLFDKYEVKRGLRDLNGQGVLTGLTEISEIRSYTVIDHDMVPCEGKLYYQGIDIEEIVDGFLQEKRFGYEEVVYLLLFGELPTESQLEDLKDILAEYRKSLPSSFVRDIIMKAPSSDLMNTLGRSVLTLYSYDTKADDTTTENVLRQCLELVALLPIISMKAAVSSCIHRKKNIRRQKTFCTCFVRTVNLHRWKQRSWISRWFFTQNMAEEITRPLRITS